MEVPPNFKHPAYITHSFFFCNLSSHGYSENEVSERLRFCQECMSKSKSKSSINTTNFISSLIIQSVASDQEAHWAQAENDH